MTTTPFHLSETEREMERERERERERVRIARRNLMHIDVSVYQVFYGIENPYMCAVYQVIAKEDLLLSYNASDEKLVRTPDIDWESQTIEEVPQAGGQRRGSSENPLASEDDESVRSTNRTLVS
jgi:hypothetical protein